MYNTIKQKEIIENEIIDRMQVDVVSYKHYGNKDIIAKSRSYKMEYYEASDEIVESSYMDARTFEMKFGPCKTTTMFRVRGYRKENTFYVYLMDSHIVKCPIK